MSDEEASTTGRVFGNAYDDRAWLRRLRVFSGRPSFPQGETDYESWAYQVDQLRHSELGEVGQRRIILQSLTHPALGLIRSLGRSPSIQQILDVTEVVYGPSADCHTLLLKFHDSLQGTDETATCYLQRLQRLLRRVVDSGEIAGENEFRDLLRQFCRGSYEDQLITNLCLESAPDRFDDFCGLLAAVRNEEIRRNDKSARLARVAVLKSKTKAVALTETVGLQQATASNGQRSSKPDEQSLQKTLTDALALQTEAIITGIKALGLGHGNRETMEEKATGGARGKRSQADASGESKHYTGQSHTGIPQQQTQRRSFYCYNCGRDGHMLQACNNPTDIALVQRRLSGQKKQSAGGRHKDSANAHLDAGN